jgi:hypothetical protein
MERWSMPTQVIASSLGLIGFIIAILAGLAADNPATTTIVRALAAMFICYVVGMMLGTMATHALNEHIEQYKRSNPMPANVAGPGEASDVVVIEPEEDSAAPIGAAQASVEDDATSRGAARTTTTTTTTTTARPRKGVAA